MGEECPVCSRRFDSSRELQNHVNYHFDDFQEDDEVQIVGSTSPAAPAARPAAGGAARAATACPQCGATVTPGELDSHLLAHQLEQEDLRQLEAGGGASGDAGAAAAAAARAAVEASDAAAAAALAAAEWGDEAGGWGGGGGSDGGGASDGEAVEAAAHQAHLEELYFEQLRAKYGFTSAPRPGACRICSEPGHWARECPRNPEVQAAAERVLDPPAPAAISATQKRALPTALAGPGGLVGLLAGCLEAQPTPRGAGPGDYAAALCGAGVQHFGATLFSSGWGCGYNNMQMLAAHLLAARPEAREVLFGAAGWVPDIPALQAWLEAAWRAGFDPQGAEQLGGRVQGTQKWVGTTEAAALLRSFGLRAQIVDFGTQRSRQGAGAAAAAAAGAAAGAGRQVLGGSGGSVPVHPNVECDACGQCPIRGDRYCSESRPNYDLCAACHASPAAAVAGPFRKMMPGGALQMGAGGAAAGARRAGAVAAGHASSSGGATAGGDDHASVAQQLLLWVWRYFTSEDEQDRRMPRSNGGGAPAAAVAAAGLGRGGGGAAAGTAAAGGVGGMQWASSTAAAAAVAAAAGGGAQGEAGEGPGSTKRLRLEQSRVRISGRPPLYFQHEGHSRTIVGIERRVVGRAPDRHPQFTILVLDPGTPGPRLAAALAARQGWQRLLRRGGHTLRHGQYQLMFVEPGVAQGAEREALKTLAACERY